MGKTGFSLRTTIVLNFTVVMFITMLLISFVVLTITRKNVLDQKIKTGETILKSLQYIILPSIQKMDNGIDHSINSESLKHTIEQYTNDVGIKNPVVVDSSLTILSHEQEKIVYKKSRDPDLKQAIHSGSTIKKFRPYLGKEHLSISAPFFQRNKIMGAIKIMLPLDDVEEGMVDYRQTVLLFTISTAFTFIIIGSFLLTRYLVKPLERMIKATEDITEGYFPQNMEPTGRNEIGTLSASLSRMSHKLEEDKKQIGQYITSLEDSNKKLKKAQDEVLRSEKLASVGKLAAGIAHEIGNPIGIIIGYIEILRQNTSPKEENLDMLKRVENEIMRIDKIIRELLGFSHPSKAALHPLQVNPLIEEAASLISHQKAFHDIELDLRLQDGLPFITADEQQFQQVMINLFINAMDAMQGGGGLTVVTEQYNDRQNPSNTSSNSSDVRITVKDTGVGIEENHLSEIFDPFYTTKSPGKGTGLGLSICLRIIESFRGKISVKSSRSEGTTFTIMLPATS